jgi:hypothetical protein
MPWNEKSLRLRAARDLLHQKGDYEPSFKRKVELIVEILGLQHSPRGLSWCRRYTAKLRDQTPNPTPEQLTLLGVLDDRLFKKGELVKARQERKKRAKTGKKQKTSDQSTTLAPQPVLLPGAVDPMSV